jgi:nanoRNase/pAp phosphatase (c-di-AMP/oligoRNAs hydrolase)
LLDKLFNVKTYIYYSGIIGRAENKKMIEVFEIPVNSLKVNESLPNLPVILLDTQPGTGNNPLKSIKKLRIIIDHHPVNQHSLNIPYADIRIDFGSSSSIVYDYFEKFDLRPSVNIATALYYGIQSDVIGEGRTAFKIDFDIMEKLGDLINREKLYLIENPKLPFDYYIHINKGMENSVIYDDFLITNLGDLENPDYIGEIADFLVRFDRCSFVLVIGIYKDILQLSFRSQKKKIHAGIIIKKIVGRLGSAGGHSSSSGGRVFIRTQEDIPIIVKKIITRSLHLILGKITSGVPLLSLRDYLNY